MMEEGSMTVCTLPLSAQRSDCANEREEKHIIASFTGSQPTMHLDSDRQFP